MHDHPLDDLIGWRTRSTVALATVVSTVGSSPRGVGATMAMASDGRVSGSLSGGCVEGDVHARAMGVLESGVPELVAYGVSDEEAMNVGLTCGGSIEVFIAAVSLDRDPVLESYVDRARCHAPGTMATVIAHPDPVMIGGRLLVGPSDARGSLGSYRLDAAVVDDARGLLASGTSATLSYGRRGERRGEGIRVLFATTVDQPRMIVVGATDFARALASQGKLLGFHVTVCDARETFATASRFPDADQVVVDWPHRYLQQQLRQHLTDERTVICVLTHDPKFDIPLLECLLTEPAGRGLAYVGVMGSRRTHDQRLARLRACAVPEADLARMHSPVGLDLGARTPEEVAVSIAAEIIASRWNGSGKRLMDLEARIHLADDRLQAGEPTLLFG